MPIKRPLPCDATASVPNKKPCLVDANSPPLTHRYNLRKRRRCDDAEPAVAVKKTKTSLAPKKPAAEKPAAEKTKTSLRPKRANRRRAPAATTLPPSPPPDLSSHTPRSTSTVPAQPAAPLLALPPSPPPGESRNASPPTAIPGGATPTTEPRPTFFPPIEDLDEPIPVTRIPVLADFSCTFVRELQSNDTAAVLLVSMPDSTQRILKVFVPDPPTYSDPFSNEYSAYCSLVHHGICLPPSTSAKRVVPYCYGAIRLHPKRHIKRVRFWNNHLKKLKTPLYSLLLEFIPDAPSILHAPERLARRPELVADIVAALRMVHSAGVLHEDPLPRNILIDGNDGVWWLDFGSSISTRYSKIHENWFTVERRRVAEVLRDDVVPSTLAGRIPRWRIRGF
ncbi:hypothetical protein FN846DRAFT_947752 [Sphaerosporella brunnea]|uniref:Protein kinase domain-containing protein n=1 Tax=Sphaerosporella brunnea TaxID=1250544 RepID=A0A5J5EXM9_9PEZI|nr:hypothetical protein FN846DRAFT_947752 [Sphaerosporella brunnea]